VEENKQIVFSSRGDCEGRVSAPKECANAVSAIYDTVCRKTDHVIRNDNSCSRPARSLALVTNFYSTILASFAASLTVMHSKSEGAARPAPVRESSVSGQLRETSEAESREEWGDSSERKSVKRLLCFEKICPESVDDPEADQYDLFLHASGSEAAVLSLTSAPRELQ